MDSPDSDCIDLLKHDLGRFGSDLFVAFVASHHLEHFNDVGLDFINSGNVLKSDTGVVPLLALANVKLQGTRTCVLLGQFCHWVFLLHSILFSKLDRRSNPL